MLAELGLLSKTFIVPDIVGPQGILPYYLLRSLAGEVIPLREGLHSSHTITKRFQMGELIPLGQKVKCVLCHILYSCFLSLHLSV